ncbi:hypothetical protein [Caudoviricetes sp.]|nr:hypothetical protein [Caudoviricetes sp.]
MTGPAEMEPRDFKRISAFPRFPSPLRKETAEMGFRRLFYTPPRRPWVYQHATMSDPVRSLGIVIYLLYIIYITMPISVNTPLS